MRILIIAPYFFPYTNPRAFRWNAIARQWAKEGHDVRVVCSKKSKLVQSKMPTGLTIYPVGINSLKELLFDPVQGSKDDYDEAYFTPTRMSEKQTFGRLVQFVNQWLWKPFYFPDDAWLWYFKARTECMKLLKSIPFDAVVSVSLPFTAHLVGLSCKKHFPQVRWLADCGDPFSLQESHPLNNPFFYRNLNVKKEEQVLASCDVITGTVDGVRELFEEYFPVSKGKIHIVPPISDNPSFQNIRLQLEEDKIHIGYFGSFFKGVREPGQALGVLRELLLRYPDLSQKVKLHFFGSGYEKFLAAFKAFPGIKENVALYEALPRQAVAYMMFRMDMLLHIGNSTSFQLPSKSVEYLRSGRPVLNFFSIKEDTFRNFSMDFSNVYHFYLNGIDYQQLFEVISKKGRQDQESRPGPGWFRQFEPEFIARTYLALLQREDYPVKEANFL